MKIEDLIQLLNNRLREFKLSKDYARMSGDLERMNASDKEIIALEDTLYQLNLLVDTSKSAAVKEANLAAVITDGSVSVLGEYDITSYATDPEHEEKIMHILSRMAVMDTVEKIDAYIEGKYLSSPVTGEMIMSASLAYIVDIRLMMAIMEQDSRFGTVGVAVSTLNPGNVGNNDDGDTRTYESWQEGVTAVAEWLNRHRVSQAILATTVTLPTTTATTTPVISTTTPITATSTTTTTLVTATTTPTTITTNEISITPLISTTTPTTTSTTTTATTTPTTTTSTITTPVTATTTPTTITTNEISITPVISTTTPTTTTSTITTPVVETSSVEEIIPIITPIATIVVDDSTDVTSAPQVSSSQETINQETVTTTVN